MSGTLLEARGLRTGYGRLPVVFNVDLEVKEGEIVALLGANGAGKTTTLRALSGMLPLMAGDVSLDGKSLKRSPPDAIARGGVVHVPQGRGIFPNLSVLENLCIGLPGKRDPEREDYVFGCFPRLKERLKQSGNTLSGGEQQMLAIARCLMMRPKLIILDEPTEGIMPRLVSQIRREIYRINQSGVSILLVEQNVETAFKLCPRVFMMEKGTIVHSGTSLELKSQTEIVHRYLGVSR